MAQLDYHDAHAPYIRAVAAALEATVSRSLTGPRRPTTPATATSSGPAAPNWKQIRGQRAATPASDQMRNAST